jgi:hypothetical protein
MTNQHSRPLAFSKPAMVSTILPDMGGAVVSSKARIWRGLPRSTVDRGPVPTLPSDLPTVTLTDAQHRCTNCGAVVSDKYCGACGQSVQSHLQSLWEFLAEATEVLTHADSRLWRTMSALVARPGFLTQQYLAGHRVSYIPPFRLYLFFSVVFFLLVSLTDARSTPRARATAASSPSAALSDGRSAIEAAATAAAPTREQFCQGFVGHSKLQSVNRMRQPFLAACIKSQGDNGREFRENFVRNLGRAMFLLLPVLAGFMKLMYWRPRRSYVNHLLLLFHNHAFVFLLMASVLAELHWIDADGADWLAGVLIGYLAYYLYQSMQRVYAESWWRTLIKFTALSAVYVACAVCTVAIAGLYSAVTL